MPYYQRRGLCGWRWWLNYSKKKVAVSRRLGSMFGRDIRLGLINPSWVRTHNSGHRSTTFRNYYLIARFLLDTRNLETVREFVRNQSQDLGVLIHETLEYWFQEDWRVQILGRRFKPMCCDCTYNWSNNRSLPLVIGKKFARWRTTNCEVGAETREEHVILERVMIKLLGSKVFYIRLLVLHWLSVNHH